MAKRLKGTQAAFIKDALLSGKAITHLDLIKACGGKGGWRTGAYIHALAKDEREPWPILRAYSGERRIATYQLAKGFKPGGPQQRELPL